MRTRIAAVAVTVALTACGSSGGDGANEPTTTTISPLAELMGWTNDSPTESRRKQLQIEELVADCMREQGWEYTPVDWAAQDPGATGADWELQMNDPQAFGEKHGYGVVYNYELYEEPSLLGETSEGAPVSTMAPNANDEYVQSLGESEQSEYYASLYGEPMMDVPVEGEDSATAVTAAAIAIEDQGCYGQANAEVYPQNETMNDPDIQERLSEYWQDQQDAPEMQAAYEDWYACMGDEFDLTDAVGDPVETPNDIWTYLDGLKNEALGLEAQAITQEDMNKGDVNFYTASTDENGNGVAWVGTPEPMDDVALEELRTTEVKLWKQDQVCQDEARIVEIASELEQRFVDELTAEFPELGGS